MSKYIKYEHWDGYPPVWVKESLKGQHREYCLCWSCKRFYPDDRETNCRIANLVFSVCVQAGLTLPVWECPNFKEKP